MDKTLQEAIILQILTAVASLRNDLPADDLANYSRTKLMEMSDEDLAIALSRFSDETLAKGQLAEMQSQEAQKEKEGLLVDRDTGLGTKDACARMISERASLAGDWSVIFMDLNGLKAVNDNIGEFAGDDLIKVAGKAIRGSTREGEGFRIGGDDFVVVLQDCPSEVVQSKAIDITNAFMAMWNNYNNTNAVPNEFVGMSYGIATTKDKELEGATFETLKAAAFASMKEHKTAPIDLGNGQYKKKPTRDETVAALKAHMQVNGITAVFKSPEEFQAHVKTSGRFTPTPIQTEEMKVSQQDTSKTD